MPAVVTFDGPNKVITEISAAGDNTLDVDEIYSEWKVWAATGDNLKYLPAFTPVGGDDIDGTLFVGSSFFLENGWRIRPAELDHRLTLVGNLYTREPGEAPVIATVGSYNVLVTYQFSNLSYTTAAGGGTGDASWEATSAISGKDFGDLLEEVWLYTRRIAGQRFET